jgi:hypothetical protein
VIGLDGYRPLASTIRPGRRADTSSQPPALERNEASPRAVQLAL